MAVRLDSHHYETLIAVVDAGSVGAASSLLQVSASAVSHRLAEAERRLGVKLFDRRAARGMLPTPAGLILYQAARRAIPELERAEHDVLSTDGDPADVVRIGVGSYDCYHWFAGFHPVAAAALPGVLLELVVVGDAPDDRLSERTVDVVLAPGRPSGTFHSLPLFVDELVLLVHPQHPAASADWVEPSIVTGERLLTYSTEPSPGFEFERFLRPANVSPSSVTTIQQTGAIAEMVASGLGMAILSRWAVTPWIEAGTIAEVRCGPRGLPLDWNALMRPGTPESGVEHATAALLAEWLTTIASVLPA